MHRNRNELKMGSSRAEEADFFPTIAKTAATG